MSLFRTLLIGSLRIEPRGGVEGVLAVIGGCRLSRREVEDLRDAIEELLA